MTEQMSFEIVNSSINDEPVEISLLSGAMEIGLIEINEDELELATARAALIVHSVNALPALVKALEDLIAECVLPEDGMEYEEGEWPALDRARDLVDRLRRMADPTTTGNDLADIARAADEIDRLQGAKRRALRIADERAFEASELRAKLAKAESQLARARTALEIIAAQDEGFLGQTARAALTDEHGK